MANETTYIKTDYIDVFDKQTALKVLELDLSHGINEAAKQFAAWWNDGIILRSADPKAPALANDEIMAVAGRKGIGEFADLKGYAMCVRYVDASTGRVAHPASHPVRMGGYVTMSAPEHGYDSTPADVLGLQQAIDAMCRRVVFDEPSKQQEQRRAITAEFNDTQADRYAEGLYRVRKLNARDKLRAEILAVEDDTTRRKLIAEYPELFNQHEADAMAENIRMGSYAEDVAAWQAARTPEGDADAAHNLDTAGTNLRTVAGWQDGE